MNEIKATKKIILCGTSLTVNVTLECRALELERGNYVDIIIRPHEEYNGYSDDDVKYSMCDERYASH